VIGAALLIFGGGLKLFGGFLATGMVSTATHREVGLVDNLQDLFELSTMTSDRGRRFETEFEGDFGGDLSRAIFSEMDGEIAGSPWGKIVVVTEALLSVGSEAEVVVVTSY